MRIEEIRESIDAGEWLNATRPSWNDKKLEFWVKFQVLELNLEGAVFGTKRYRESLAKKTVLETCYTWCKDETLVPDAFELTEEDHCADDWVII